MSALRSSRPNFLSIITGIVTAFLAVFLFALPAQAAPGEGYLIVPDMVLGNVEGTEEVFSSLYTELEKQGVPAENIVNFRYDPYDGITTVTEELSVELDALTQVTGDTEISVLGYGVGGLIVRNYLESDSFRDNIESVVFGATPHEGTIAYTEHIYGKNITYLNSWERLYWEGKDVPMLMKQTLPTNLPLFDSESEKNLVSEQTLTFDIASPLEIEVQTPSGKVLSQESPQVDFEEEQAFMITLGEQDKKAIFIREPEEGEYKVNLKSNGVGEFVVTSSLAQGEQVVESYQDGETKESGEEYEYVINLDVDNNGELESEFELVNTNTPPVAFLDQKLYEGFVGQKIVFDGSASEDEDGDTLKYKWIITDTDGNEIVSTNFTEENTFTYSFSNVFEGVVTVSDGESEDVSSSEVIIQEAAPEDSITVIKELLGSLEEDTTYISSKKRLWLRLVELLQLPEVKNNDRLENIIVTILEKDIERSLVIDRRLEKSWFWWRRVDPISEQNEEILRKVLEVLK